MLASPVARKECGLKPAQALLFTHFHLLTAQLWYLFGLSHVHTPLCWPGYLRKTFTLLPKF